MIVKTLIVTVILVAIVMLALGIKMLFDKNAKFEVRSCSFDNHNEEETCNTCPLNDPDKCVESEKK